MSNIINKQHVDDLKKSCNELKMSYDTAKLRIDRTVILLLELKKQLAALGVCKVLLDGILAKIRGFYG